jgi:hypothetical protein
MGSSTPKYAENHTIDPETGFMESKAYVSAFDAPRKLKFLELYKANGMGLYRTCRALGLSTDTVNIHYHKDPVFKAAYDEAKVEYGDELESTSRINALNPRSVIERIFQLKSLFPEKYGDQKSNSAVQVNISFDPSLLKNISIRQNVLEAEVLKESSTSDITP